MSFEACARIVERGDPDRFLAVMSAAPEVRRVLFPIYAFNVEVARAPWVTEEPMIAEMRLQWWRDALEEIANGGPVRNHEVTTELATVLDADGARALDGLVAARRWDVYKDPFEDVIHFEEYLNATAGDLLWTATRLVARDQNLAERDYGPDGFEGNVKRYGFGVGMANWFRAIPDLEARGRKPLADGTLKGVGLLASGGLRDLDTARRSMEKDGGAVRGPVADVLRVGWRAKRTLTAAKKTPARVAHGDLEESPMMRRASLTWRTLRGTF